MCAASTPLPLVVTSRRSANQSMDAANRSATQCLSLTRSLFMVVMASYKTRLKLLKALTDYKQAELTRRSNDNVDAL
ncbi:unnamed protein product [Hydatigera taeniaeformis]|uniref:Vps5 domain-containing protein n=1 Tax=Hydatigena taeniaeformis TaxID=6205 RepID=A0A0R3WZA0_HYDTA|nr:unnamed protein product [Hydatigera taeniaeformis]